MQQQERELVIATSNEGKVREFVSMFTPLGIRVRGLRDFPELPDVEEDGSTFAQNAEKKAVTIAKLLGLPVMADDSGLCVDALDGAPGVYSARYSGEGATSARNNAKLLEELGRLQEGAGADDLVQALPEHPEGLELLSRARFVCVLAFYDPAAGETLYAEGECPGWIQSELRGEGGFGYDPLFYLPEFKKTMAQLSPEQKNSISHRGEALRKMLELLASR
jgi:XTP/dITP diphosphohydrolase